eukprot:8936503-Ditylum_brightwellii.AAC.1
MQVYEMYGKHKEGIEPVPVVDDGKMILTRNAALSSSSKDKMDRPCEVITKSKNSDSDDSIHVDGKVSMATLIVGDDNGETGTTTIEASHVGDCSNGINSSFRDDRIIDDGSIDDLGCDIAQRPLHAVEQDD